MVDHYAFDMDINLSMNIWEKSVYRDSAKCISKLMWVHILR